MTQANITNVDSSITCIDRTKFNNHKPHVIWFSGLSGSGKSTLAQNLQKKLFQNNLQTYVLDGDNIRNGLCADLSFSKKDRAENMRRVSEVAKLFHDNGTIVIVALISPYQADRDLVQRKLKSNCSFIHIKASTQTCMQRDPKGLYARAKAGEIKNFSGISDDYQVPVNPDLVIDTEKLSVAEATEKLLLFVLEKVKL